MKPRSLADRISLILTTSPVPSNPSIECIHEAVESLVNHLSKDLVCCHLVLVLDGYVQSQTDKPQHKSGRIQPDEIENYELYKRRLKDWLRSRWILPQETWQDPNPEPSQHQLETSKSHVAEFSTVHLISTSPADEYQNGRIRLTFLEVSGPRLGFGLGVKTAMDLIRTPYVIISQHDWVFTRTVPLTTLLDDMDAYPDTLEYIGFKTKKNFSEAKTETRGFPSAHIEGHQPWKSPLCRLYFWYDRNHIARVSHYKSLIFNGETHIKRGDFLEDTFGHRMMADIRSGISDEDKVERHASYGTFFYSPLPDQVYLRHLHGRKYHQREQVAQLLQRLGQKPKPPSVIS